MRDRCTRRWYAFGFPAPLVVAASRLTSAVAAPETSAPSDAPAPQRAPDGPVSDPIAAEPAPSIPSKPGPPKCYRSSSRDCLSRGRASASSISLDLALSGRHSPSKPPGRAQGRGARALRSRAISLSSRRPLAGASRSSTRSSARRRDAASFCAAGTRWCPAKRPPTADPRDAPWCPCFRASSRHHAARSAGLASSRRS